MMVVSNFQLTLFIKEGRMWLKFRKALVTRVCHTTSTNFFAFGLSILVFGISTIIHLLLCHEHMGDSSIAYQGRKYEDAVVQSK